MGNISFLQGNEACAEGALYAGCNFFAGYPISPSSEIAEFMSRGLPRGRGVFIEMEDEIASMGAIIGASIASAKAMTATSGSGFSLKQEHTGSYYPHGIAFGEDAVWATTLGTDTVTRILP